MKKKPCELKTPRCPFEYGPKCKADIEGMPILGRDDPRTCDTYGHICPQYMSDFGLTVKDLEIRAALHCGAVAEKFETTDDILLGTQLRQAAELARKTKRQFPKKRFPQYYD